MKKRRRHRSIIRRKQSNRTADPTQRYAKKLEAKEYCCDQLNGHRECEFIEGQPYEPAVAEAAS